MSIIFGPSLEMVVSYMGFLSYMDARVLNRFEISFVVVIRKRFYTSSIYLQKDFL